MKKTKITNVATTLTGVFVAFRLMGPRGLCMVAAIFAAFAVPLLARPASAMGTEEKGNKPLSEFNYTKWKGIVPVVNDRACVYQVWVNGNENLYYKGATAQNRCQAPVLTGLSRLLYLGPKEIAYAQNTAC